MTLSEKVVALAAPAAGPAFVALFDPDRPILALVLSGLGLVLARWVAPPPLRKLSRSQHWALTLLLLIVLFLIVTGEFTGEPLGPGWAVIVGIGLGSSGLVAISIFKERVEAMLRAMLGVRRDE